MPGAGAERVTVTTRNLWPLASTVLADKTGGTLVFVYAIRQIVPLPSSVISKAPSCATVTPTGRPQTLRSLVTKPVRKSSYRPVGTPLFNGIRTSLYPVRVARFHDP